MGDSKEKNLKVNRHLLFLADQWDVLSTYNKYSHCNPYFKRSVSFYIHIYVLIFVKMLGSAPPAAADITWLMSLSPQRACCFPLCTVPLFPRNR